ncbi:HisA/HisF-related TIM barrel protein [Acidiplasma cupricumulans]|uniref:HisA/HisF-related TIM barrel protein n=1 Tax=Acidiplasma cupricumulans TaxID=312540 RepID=UPI00191BF670|nr:HisA/HisF-related TIM barrel protein [Acidiplasma cupricumulans]
MIRLGADKVFINTYAIINPDIIKKASYEIGSSNLVIAIDAKFNGSYYEVYSNSGEISRNINAVEWAKTVEELGAGEILLTSIDADGTRKGYDYNLIKKKFLKM